MSLFGTINNSATSLQTAQIGLQTVGTNIANADTEGYIRQTLEQTTPAPYRKGNLILGHGVRASGIVQQVDQALQKRMWSAGSDLAAASLRDRVLSDVEALLNDLNGGGLSADLNALNSAIHDLSVEPNDESLREFVVLTADSLSKQVNRLYTDARDYQTELDASLGDTVDRVNFLVEKIADLNLRVTTLEGGNTLSSDASGVRDERYRAIEELSELVKVKVQEQASGAVSIFIGGDYLVADTHARQLYVNNEREANSGKVLFKDTESEVEITGGELKSMTEGRDTLLGGVLTGLDEMAINLIREFNTVHAQGQGERGFHEITGNLLLNPTAALNDSGVQWPVDGGTFEISLVDVDGNHISLHQIDVRQGNPVTASSVQTIVEEINAIDGLSAQVMPAGEIHIESELEGVRFAFGADSSGFLAASGLNSFFVGNGAETLSVAPLLKTNPHFLSVSATGVGQDTATLNTLVDLIERDIERNGGSSIRDQYTQIVTRLSQTAANQKAEMSGLAQYYATLNSEHLAITGVNIDEEAIRMIAYQRTFQASSRVIAVANEMLDILTSL
ncbi:flagellar hook-associated protein FlgK [Planctomycetaceae bacterium SH139]